MDERLETDEQLHAARTGEPLEDGIEADNHAVAVVPSSPELDVQVQGESSLFLNALFTATPQIFAT